MINEEQTENSGKPGTYIDGQLITRTSHSWAKETGETNKEQETRNKTREETTVVHSRNKAGEHRQDQVCLR